MDKGVSNQQSANQFAHSSLNVGDNFTRGSKSSMVASGVTSSANNPCGVEQAGQAAAKGADLYQVKAARNNQRPQHSVRHFFDRHFFGNHFFGKDDEKAVDYHQDPAQSMKGANTSENKQFAGCNKPVYPVLCGDTVKVFSTSAFAVLPKRDTYMVKERHTDSLGNTRIKLVLKKSDTTYDSQPRRPATQAGSHNGGSTQEPRLSEESHFYYQNRKPKKCIFSHDDNFNLTTHYEPESKDIAENKRIGKGGNGFIFTTTFPNYNGKIYAVKKTVYRPNEIKIHSALHNGNILPLHAVFMGGQHESLAEKFYCFHFMPVMKFDLRKIMSAKDVGCLQHYYGNLRGLINKTAASGRATASELATADARNQFDTAFNNVINIIEQATRGVNYMHTNGYIHRDVKASNIMLKMACRHATPLKCDCKVKTYQVRLGDFDSSGTIPGYNVPENTDQLIKFASILPLGTGGYRAPEVSMHIVLAGPYETLYTTAVDIWSVGCLLLNLCIGKTAAVKQREQALLLLSKNEYINGAKGTEISEEILKINKLQKASRFCDKSAFVKISARLSSGRPRKKAVSWRCLNIDGGNNQKRIVISTAGIIKIRTGTARNNFPVSLIYFWLLQGGEREARSLSASGGAVTLY